MVATPTIGALVQSALLLFLASHAPVSHAQVPCPARCRSCSNGVADCSQQSLTAPPKTYPPDTVELNLEGNHIRVLGMRTFNSLPSLEVLKISQNKITSIRNDAFRNFPNLMTLDLTGNRIYRIYRRSLRRMNRLRTLTLNRNRIRSLARIFEHVPNLYQLNLAKNKIRSIGVDDLSSLTNLHYVDFRDNSITSIHSRAFKELTSLRYLFLNNNPLVSMPTMQFGSQVLQLVDLSHCRLTSVPQPLPASVGDLRLGNNRLSQIQHTDFINITDLQLLALNDNDLQFLADGTFSHLTQLQEVWLRGNRLVYIPRDLPDNVRKVHMDSNNLQQIEGNLFRPSSRLDYLTVENNQITRVAPDTFSGLRFLNTLNFQGNQIRSLEQRTFSDLGSLSTLLLSNNPMERIERLAFHHLGNLTTLLMSHLTTENFTLDASFLPHMLRLRMLGLMNSPGLAQALMDLIANGQVTLEVLSHVTHLDLSYNTLEWVSPRVRTVFPALQSMTLDGNPLRCSRRLRWLGDWMRTEERVNFFNYEEPVCETPGRLRGRPLRSLDANEWAEENEPDGGGMGGDYEVAARGLGELQADAAPREEGAGPPPAAVTIGRGGGAEGSVSVRGGAKEKEVVSPKRGRGGKEKRRGKAAKRGGRRRKGKGEGRKGKKSGDKKKGKKADRKKNRDRKRKNKKGKGRRRKREATEVFVNDEGTPLGAEEVEVQG
ncbi:slit homolog 3 protein [Aplysia californica]|uniref:Slit homolog 3 protein n=1 Tax=Aplysia californica TaxID=6500 RepID=A0ABM1ADT4_APLCA|nr:slit homolog 3 protein [Aplysia californica]